MIKPTHSSDSDQQTMSTFRYSQELRRTIRLFGSFAVAFSFISITTGIFANYDTMLDTSGPVGIWMWPIVTVGQLLVALVFAELAARMPITGYSYQWVTRLGGHAWGWMTGWVAFCFLVIVVPSVDHGVASVIGYMADIPEGSQKLTVIVCATITIQAVIHVFGVKLADRINSIAVFTEIVGMLGLIIILGVLLIKDGASGEMITVRGDHITDASWITTFLMAALMGAYTLVGFESAANLSEETVNAGSTVPKAVIWSVLVSGIVGTVFLLVTTLSIGDLGEVIDATYALPTIIESRLGSVIANAFFVLVIISIFACGLIIMASGSRLIYAMARDDVFPMSDMFSSVSEKSGAPIPAVVLMLALGLLAELFSESLEQLLLAAAVLPALIYLSTIVAYLKQRDSMPLRFGTFTLGRFGKPIGVMAAGWLLLVIGVLTIPEEFQFTALVSLLLCLSGLIPYYLWAAGKDNAHGNS
ncbi:MAG: amino acid permease [Rickettsiales bacterium]|nr:amino acid permease [Rickettsiales bacterium]